MGLGRSLQIAATGFSAVELGIQVTSNNVANVRSTAFKASRAEFTNLFYDIFQSPRAATDDDAGQNPIQIGQGTALGSVTLDLSEGEIVQTGLSDDLYISGGGFFIARNEDQLLYTRNGDLQKGSRGELTTARGFPIQGYTVDDDYVIDDTALTDLVIPIGVAQFGLATTVNRWSGTVDPTGDVATQATIRRSAATNATSLDDPLDGIIIDGASLINDGSGTFTEPVEIRYVPETAGGKLPETSLTFNPGDPLSKLTDFIVNALAINTTVPQPVGNTAGGALGSAGEIQITGNLGDNSDFHVRASDFVVQRLSDNTLGSLNLELDVPVQVANGSSAIVQSSVFDSDGEPVSLYATIYLERVDSTGSQWRMLYSSPDQQQGDTTPRPVGQSLLTFNNFGRFASATDDSATIYVDGRDVDSPLVFQNNFDSIFALPTNSNRLGITTQDGLKRGTLEDFQVAPDGTIIGSFDNGGKQTIGQIVLATFPNPTGLLVESESFFKPGLTSGDARIGIPGETAGTVGSGGLEQANTEVSEVLVDLLSYAAAFNANSRVFATSQELLTDFTRLVRQL